MEEGERKTSTKISASQSQAPPIYKHPTANGKSSGSVEKVPQLAGHAGGNSSTAEGLAGIAAKILSSKAKVQGASKGGTTTRKKDKHNGFDDDLPLGSEAHSLSLDHGTDIDGKYPVNEEKRSKWRKTSSLGMMGWQSFNSDVSNQTSASSASLEQLLNDRQVDPEEMLMSLGFGGGPQSLMPTLARVPERFLHHPSRAYGITPPNLSEELEDEDDTDAVLPLPDKGTAPSAIMAAAAPPTRKRPGGFCLRGFYLSPHDGYVNLVGLLGRDVPLYFFNGQGSKCYCVSVIQDELGEGTQSRDVGGGQGYKEYSFTGEQDKVGECGDTKLESEFSIGSCVQTKPATDCDNMSSSQDIHSTDELQPDLKEPPEAEEEMSEKISGCFQKHCLKDPGGVRAFSEGADQLTAEGRSKEGMSRFFNTHFVKMAAQKIGDSINEKIKSSFDRQKSNKPACVPECQDSVTYKPHLSPIQRLHKNVSSSYANFTAKLGIKSRNPWDNVPEKNQHDAPEPHHNQHELSNRDLNIQQQYTSLTTELSNRDLNIQQQYTSTTAELSNSDFNIQQQYTSPTAELFHSKMNSEICKNELKAQTRQLHDQQEEHYHCGSRKNTKTDFPAADELTRYHPGCLYDSIDMTFDNKEIDSVCGNNDERTGVCLNDRFVIRDDSVTDCDIGLHVDEDCKDCGCCSHDGCEANVSDPEYNYPLGGCMLFENDFGDDFYSSDDYSEDDENVDERYSVDNVGCVVNNDVTETLSACDSDDDDDRDEADGGGLEWCYEEDDLTFNQAHLPPTQTVTHPHRVHAFSHSLSADSIHHHNLRMDHTYPYISTHHTHPYISTYYTHSHICTHPHMSTNYTHPHISARHTHPYMSKHRTHPHLSTHPHDLYVGYINSSSNNSHPLYSTTDDTYRHDAHIDHIHPHG